VGKLIYGTIDVDIEDRLLAHLQIVIVNKLRRGEPLLMSWLDSPSIGDGRSAVWLNPNITLYFKFAGSRSPQIDREWLRILSESADSSTGLILRTADGKLAYASGKRGGA
jgi:hypothetical protein